MPASRCSARYRSMPGMTSGLPYGSEDDLATFVEAWAADGQPAPATPMLRRRAVLAWALQSPPAGPTGEFLYSNIGYELVAWMLDGLRVQGLWAGILAAVVTGVVSWGGQILLGDAKEERE